MRKQPGIDNLEPTPVEAPLVASMRNHREEWPYIYVEMKKVCKDDLLMDAEYCNRHRHPSMTQFFRECGEIGVEEADLPECKEKARAGKGALNWAKSLNDWMFRSH